MGVVGVGALGRHHARILSQMDGVELVAVAEAHAARGQDIAAQHGTQWLADYHDLIPLVDAVSVVVPTVAHLEVAAEFLSRGIPVLVEKPLAHELAAAEALVELAERKHTLLQVGHVERFNPAWQTAVPWCCSPKYIRAERLAPFTFRSTDIGVVLDLMIHDLDLVLSLAQSRIRSVEAFGIGVMGSHEDAAQARLTFENGCIADLTASRISPEAKRSVQVWSLSGCVTVDLHQRKVTRFAPSAALRFAESPVQRAQRSGADVDALKLAVFGEMIEIQELPVHQADALTNELREFVDCVTQHRRPLVDGVQALAAMAAADLVLKQIAAHRWEGTSTGLTGPQVLSNPAPQRKAG
jgi:predicted dehydrogenase